MEPAEGILGSDEIERFGDCLVERLLASSRRLP
jgi:hypothetical protein